VEGVLGRSVFFSFFSLFFFVGFPCDSRGGIMMETYLLFIIIITGSSGGRSFLLSFFFAFLSVLHNRLTTTKFQQRGEKSTRHDELNGNLFCHYHSERTVKQTKGDTSRALCV
jgi:hypothetical protein